MVSWKVVNGFYFQLAFRVNKITFKFNTYNQRFK